MSDDISLFSVRFSIYSKLGFIMRIVFSQNKQLCVGCLLTSTQYFSNNLLVCCFNSLARSQFFATHYHLIITGWSLLTECHAHTNNIPDRYDDVLHSYQTSWWHLTTSDDRTLQDWWQSRPSSRLTKPTPRPAQQKNVMIMLLEGGGRSICTAITWYLGMDGQVNEQFPGNYQQSLVSCSLVNYNVASAYLKMKWLHQQWVNFGIHELINYWGEECHARSWMH